MRTELLLLDILDMYICDIKLRKKTSCVKFIRFGLLGVSVIVRFGDKCFGACDMCSTGEVTNKTWSNICNNR